ncbi:MAG: hypothetical protein HC785_23255 [Calothrix sp. CSU_2_0]|nr:hypothetical protein [Calothrix sp. CSU_2_0]
MFRESSFTQSETDRRFYSEWATTERDAENYAIAIWLYAIALADSTPPLSPTLENAMVYLSNMGFGFYCLCKLKQPFDIYAKALGASEQLARSISGLVEYPNKGDTIKDLLKNRDRAQKLGINDVKPEIAFDSLVSGIVAAYESVVEEGYQNSEKRLPIWVKKGDELQFQSLKKLLNI